MQTLVAGEPSSCKSSGNETPVAQANHQPRHQKIYSGEDGRRKGLRDLPGKNKKEAEKERKVRPERTSRNDKPEITMNIPKRTKRTTLPQSAL